MPKWITPVWQCPHCDLKTDIESMLDHAQKVGMPFFDALDAWKVEHLLPREHKRRWWQR